MEVAETINCDKRKISRWMKFASSGGTISPKKSSGRPKKLTGRDLRVFSRECQPLLNQSRNSLSAKELSVKLSEPVHSHTMRSALKELGFSNVKPLRKPIISKTNARKRLVGARDNRQLAQDDLRKWVFSDEAPFCLIGSYYRGNIWVKSQDRMNSRNLQIRAQGGGGKVMIWGCISIYGPGPLLFIERNLNGQLYK